MAQVLPFLIFSRCLADFSRFFCKPILAKETAEFFDKAKAGEFTLNHTHSVKGAEVHTTLITVQFEIT